MSFFCFLLGVSHLSNVSSLTPVLQLVTWGSFKCFGFTLGEWLCHASSYAAFVTHFYRKTIKISKNNSAVDTIWSGAWDFCITARLKMIYAKQEGIFF